MQLMFCPPQPLLLRLKRHSLTPQTIILILHRIRTLWQHDVLERRAGAEGLVLALHGADVAAVDARFAA